MMKKIQEEQAAWEEKNFPNREPYMNILGAVEELGELCHAHLKSVQGIRGTTEQHEAAKKDAIADCVIFLLGYCSAYGWCFEEIVSEVWSQVRERDWRGAQK